MSTDEQSTETQRLALTAAGCTAIFEDVASGGDRSRPQLAKAVEALGPGDTLVVVRLDRLARSVLHLLDVVETIEKRGAAFRSLSDPIDTGSPQGKFTLQILGAVAELERALIRERTVAGLKTASAAGRVGGNPGLKAHDRLAIRKVLNARDLTLSERVATKAQEYLPIVREMRGYAPDEGGECVTGATPAQPWDAIVRTLNAKGVGRPQDGKPWTRDSLTRAIRRLVHDGIANPNLLDPAPRTGPQDTRLVTLVQGIAGALQKPTLGAIAAKLEALHEPTPRGHQKWSPSSVANLLRRSRTQHST